MALLQSRGKAKVAVISVGDYSPAYPNTYFKSKLLLDYLGAQGCGIILGLGGRKRSDLSRLKIIAILRLLINSVVAWVKLLFVRPEKVYICYPGVLVAILLYCFTPKKNRPKIYLDGFISLYDTVVIDRKLVSKGGWLSRLIFLVERRAYCVSEKVLLDTSCNLSYVVNLFELPSSKFSVVELSTPPIAISTRPRSKSKKFVCLFVGTLVPLQGVGVIAEAAKLLAHRTDIQIKVVGSGQDSVILTRFLRDNNLPNFFWNQKWNTTEQLVVEMENADACLGIFGASLKADRVWPLKNYLYMSAGKALITGDSSQARALIRTGVGLDPFMVVDSGSPKALAHAIETLASSASLVGKYEYGAKAFFRQFLSDEVVLSSLLKALDISNKESG